jgi:hypothetical protein
VRTEAKIWREIKIKALPANIHPSRQIASLPPETKQATAALNMFLDLRRHIQNIDRITKAFHHS